MSNTVYFHDSNLCQYLIDNGIKGSNVSADRMLILLPSLVAYIPEEVPSKPSYVVEAFPNWPNLSNEESKQLLAYQASDFGLSDGFSVQIKKAVLTPVQKMFFDGAVVHDDWLQWRWGIRDMMPSVWNDCTDFEKAISIELDILGDYSNEKIAFQMSKGLSQGFSMSKLFTWFAFNHIRGVASCRSRAEDKQVITIVARYLGEMQAIAFTKIIESLLIQYKEHAIIGTNYGSGTQDGILDFYENTGGFLNTGLADQGFVMINGDPDTSNFKDELVNWFINRAV